MSERVIVAGVDGGASSTTCVIADETGRVLGVGRGGPIDHLYLPAGRKRTREAVGEAYVSAARKDRPRRALRAVVAGLTGLEPGSAESRSAVRILKGVTRADVVHATWDAEIAFFGASAGGPGVMVIAGTGSVALGRNAAGQTARAGGYGYLIDDAGGGVSIGRAALRAALRSGEGWGPKTVLADVFRAQLGGWPEIRRRVYGEGRGRALLASLVPAVEEAARDGDTVARTILADAGRSLADLASGVATRLGMQDETFDLFLVGGVFLIGTPVIGPLRSGLRSQAVHARIRRPRFPPALGAVLMALEAAGVRPTPSTLRRLGRTL
ncbi:MAG TPA: BadF/BadG/BcrA/BcrD ATPase family protein [bacterium]|nr:BadF/BadG/BcrA/BcrD ATPase family protein [bacterium]